MIMTLRESDVDIDTRSGEVVGEADLDSGFAERHRTSSPVMSMSAFD